MKALEHSSREFRKPRRSICHKHTLPRLSLPQLSDKLNSSCLWKLPYKSCQCRMHAIIRRFTFNQMRQCTIFANRKVHLGTILGPDIMQL
jgi:hypothetical protein